LQLLDDPEMLEYPWNLSPCDAAPTADDLKALDAAMRAAGSGEIDVNEQQGKVFSRFLPDLQRDLGLVWQPENWDEVRLAAWLCRNLPEPSLTHVSKLAFVAAWLKDLRRRGGFALSRVNLQKFLIRDRLEARIRELRGQAAKQAYQQALFGENAARRSATNTPLSSPLSFTRPAAIMMIALASLISTSIITDASATSTARKNSCALVNWIYGRSKDASGSGCATSSGAKGVPSSCKRPMAAFTRISCASCPTRPTPKGKRARFWRWNTRAPTAGAMPKMTA
jgi:hypothetical protein